MFTMCTTPYISRKHAHYMVSSLAWLRDDPKFCDVVLLVGETRIPAQRLVLSAYSEYFRAMFYSGLSESYTREIRLHDVDAKSLVALLEFCYTCKLEIRPDNAKNLLTTACFFQFREAREVCCEVLELNLDMSNCLEIRQLARTHDLKKLEEAAVQFIQYHFVDLMDEESFLQLKVEEIEDLVSLSNLRVESEYCIYEAVLNWARADASARSSLLHRVLRCVRLPLLTTEFLTLAAVNEEVLASSRSCLELLKDAREFRRMPSSVRPRELRWWSRPRHRGKRFICGDVNVASNAVAHYTSPELVKLTDDHWVRFDFNEPLRVMRVEFRWTCASPVTIKLQGCAREMNWKTLTQRSYELGAYWRAHECTVPVPRKFRSYRLAISVALRELEGWNPKKWRFVVNDIKMFEAKDQKPKFEVEKAEEAENVLFS